MMNSYLQTYFEFKELYSLCEARDMQRGGLYAMAKLECVTPGRVLEIADPASTKIHIAQ